MIFEHVETGLRVHVTVERDTVDCPSRIGDPETVVTGFRLLTDAGQPAILADVGDPEMRVVLIRNSTGDLIRMVRVD